MSPARRPRWYLPVAVLTLDALLLFGAVGLGLGVPSLGFLGGIWDGSALDYSATIGGVSPLRAAYLAEQLGIALSAGPNGGANGEGDNVPTIEEPASVARAAREDVVIDRHPLTNDDFGDARAVQTGREGYYAQGTTEGAGREPGEPRASCDSLGGGGTIWYRFRSDRPSALVATTRAAGYWVVLAAYVGGRSLDDIDEVDCDADPQGNTQVELSTEAGGTYFLQLAAPLDRGTLELSVTPRRLGVTTLASISSTGTQGDDWSGLPSLSSNGRFLAFTSAATTLVPGDANICPFVVGLSRSSAYPNINRYPFHTGGRSCPDVFLHDRETQETTLISRGLDGPADGASWGPDISPNGRWVVFASMASNLVRSPRTLCPPHNKDAFAVSCSDVYLYDRTTREFEMVSVSSSGEPSLGLSDAPSISRDGRFVAFTSTATDLAPGNEDGMRRVFLRDRLRGTTRVLGFPFRATPDKLGPVAGGESPGVQSYYPQVSASGRYVGFPADYGGEGLEAYVHDLRTGETVKLSNSFRGGAADGPSHYVVLSRTGRHVAFLSSATDIVEGDPGQGGTANTPPICLRETRPVTKYAICFDVYVQDRDPDGDGVFDEPGTVETIRVSLTSSGQRTDGGTYNPSISADGRFVAFSSWQNLDQEFDPVVLERIFVHDRDADEDGIFDEPGAVVTRAVSVSSSGETGDARSGEPVLSGNGGVVAFFSDAANLVAGDDNGASDVFVRTRWWR